jgi:AcrR family transcriptional regulator
MEKSKRKEREFNLRREEILKQAEVVFADKGYYKATVAEIADTSGFCVGTIYQYFGSKEELFSSMVRGKLEILYGEIRDSVAGKKNAIEKIRALVEANFRFVEANINFCSIFIRRGNTSIAEGNADLREAMIADYLKHVAFIQEILSEGCKSSIIKLKDPRLMAFVLAGMINSFVFFWMNNLERGSLVPMTETLLDIFFEGVESSAS